MLRLKSKLFLSLLFFICGIAATHGQGHLWGVTEKGGAHENGTIFRTNPDGTGHRAQKSFSLSEGRALKSALTRAANGVFIVTPTGGGANDRGVVGMFDPSKTTGYVPSLDLPNSAIGADPSGSFVLAPNGRLYGITKKDAANNYGSITEIEIGSTILGPHNFKKVYDFTFDHAFTDSQCGLIVANGKLYGLTAKGGTYDNGTIYELTLESFVVTKKFDFNSAVSGSSPYGTPILASNGKIYGVTSSGGANDHGVLFEFDPTTDEFTKKIDFLSTTTGSNPIGDLMQASNGMLYGTTSQGGDHGNGVLFEYDIAANAITKRVDFDAAVSGAQPKGGLFQSTNGRLYGTTYAGGTHDLGVLYEYDITTSTYTKQLDFNGGNGANPIGNIIYDAVNVKSGQTITFNALPGAKFGDPSFTLTATADSGLPVTYASSNPSVASVSGNVVTILSGGSTVITASQAGDDYFYPAVTIQQTLTVDKADQTITFSALPAATFGDAPVALSATTTSGLAITYQSSNPAVATVNGTTLNIIGTGTATITALQSGNASFNAAIPVLQTITVSKASQTITFGPLAAKIKTDPAFTLTATASSGLMVVYTSSNPSVATVSGNVVTIVGNGSTTITAQQVGNANYSAATPVGQTLAVKFTQAITFSTLVQKTYGDAPFTVSATATSGLAVSFSSSNTSVATVSGNTVTIVGAGTCNIIASQAGDATYSAAPNVPRTVAVIKANQSITFPALGTRYVGDAPFSLSAAASSGLTVTYTSSVTPVATVSGNIVTINSVGTTQITAHQAGNSNYNAATSVTRSLNIVNVDPCATASSNANVDASARPGPCPEAIAAKERALTFAFLPNPADKEAFLEVPFIAEFDLPVVLYSSMGVAQARTVIKTGNSNTKIETESLSDGVYLIVVDVGPTELTKRVQVTH